jgi:hypothetical protein
MFSAERAFGELQAHSDGDAGCGDGPGDVRHEPEFYNSHPSKVPLEKVASSLNKCSNSDIVTEYFLCEF